MPTRSDADSTAPSFIHVATTPFGKDIAIHRCKSGQLFEIKVSGGGIFPPELEGKFTSRKDALDIIERYNGARVIEPTE